MKLLNHVLYLIVLSVLIACTNDTGVEEKEIDLTPDPIPEAEPIDIPEENTLGVTLYKPLAYEGYTLFTIHYNTYLINNCGQVIHQWNSAYAPGNAVYLLEDGSILRAGKIENPDMPYAGVGGIVERIGWDGSLLWSYTYSGTDHTQHHDIFPMPNGNVILLAATKKSYEEAITAGRDPSKLEDGALYNEQLVEIRPSGSNSGTVVWEWNIWDHLIQEFDSTKENWGSVENNPQLLDINYLGEGANNSDTDWLHINSVAYNEILDQLVLSIHGLDEIYIIDHSTTTIEAASHEGGIRGKGGDILYRWGNPLSYKQGDLNTRKLFKQHHPHWIEPTLEDGGAIIVFNNGNGRSESFSSVDIINPPIDTNGNYKLPQNSFFGPMEPDWSYVDPLEPKNFYSRLLSGAQRLPNGNTLICEGLNGRLFEIDSKGNIVWQYINPQTTTGAVLRQGDIPESNRLFRGTKYPKDHHAFIGRDLVPGNPIELDFTIKNCD
ncbi:MAG: aryl-sulfate sulfotransferase [Bacteroidota bacterium]